MEYREPVFPSIHPSGNIDPNSRFITMCYPLFLTQIGFCRLDILLSDYHVQEHSPKTCRWLRLSVRFDTFYEIQSFITVSSPSFLSNIFFVHCITLYPILRSTFVLISLLCLDLQSLLFASRFRGFVFISYIPFVLRDLAIGITLYSSVNINCEDFHHINLFPCYFLSLGPKTGQNFTFPLAS
jgi:hypothetical protein